MRSNTVLLGLMALMTGMASGQDTFREVVEKSFGVDQQLVNGIQFSNHYGRIEGHPYLMDGRFREGSLQVHGRIYNDIRIRYNLYTQRPEIEYRTADGYLNQFMAVPERIDWFLVGGTAFRRLQPLNLPPAFYQVVSMDGDTCYVSWIKQLGSSTGSSSGYRFNPPEVSCILRMDGHTMLFHNRKTLIKSFPAIKKKTLKRFMNGLNYPFREPEPARYEEFARKLIQLYWEEQVP